MPPQKRDDITTAFCNSAYATPYGDNTIPGNHPGCRRKHLGRQYAPQPINKSSLMTDLHVPGCGLGRHGPVLPADINNHVRYTLLQRDNHNSNYVLDTERGGKRHFEEERAAEKVWLPSLRQLDPPIPEALLRPRQRRGLGVYNHVVCGPGLKAMMERRDREAARERIGKAHVCGMPDHRPTDLGLYHLLCSGEPPSTHGDAAAAAPPVEASSSSASRPVEEKKSSVEASTPVEPSRLTFLAFFSPSADETRMRGMYMGGCRQPINVPDLEKGSTLAEQRRKAEVAQARLEDIRLVQLLPKL
ncbi:hypothetical protein TraAM80_05149 [Trypanosoma rangeli]|uniref:Uncharacterized protein n=1 Tax=Trypanosoma rangeli TaxID=5698 RepID=A0A422NGF9_TRYRA|nr:uncharacterized protein TraAM80_05149 [Trypanosoma rangeli]RNF04551.1 hypothetical protein TraAM80_05149 [Trypanosoma rangeli]|eukprot:RNF04551.1 hypothetical protein TraAM80_05149 [Trypanosoma rangeli]